MSKAPPDPPFRVLDSSRPFKGKVVTVRIDRIVDDDGQTGEREVVEHNGAVAALVVDDDGQVVLVDQWRHAVGARVLEVAAGKYDVDGETVEDALRRELNIYGIFVSVIEPGSIRTEIWEKADPDLPILRTARDEYAALSDVTAITAVRAAVFNEFFPTETHAAIAAIACNDLDFGFVNEFHGYELDRKAARFTTKRPRGRTDFADRGNTKPRLSGASRHSDASLDYSAATTLTVRRFFRPLTENSTLPSTSANSVWSRPRPTPMPGWNWVPR